MRIGIMTILAVLSGWSTLVSAQGLAQGIYEVTVSWGSSASRAISSYEVVPGETIPVGIGAEILYLTVLPSSGSEYALQVGVTRDDTDPVQNPHLASSQQHVGVFGVPIELRDSRDAEGLDRYPTGITITVRSLSPE